MGLLVWGFLERKREIFFFLTSHYFFLTVSPYFSLFFPTISFHFFFMIFYPKKIRRIYRKNEGMGG